MFSFVLFIKEYFYRYFVVKRKECISLDCIREISDGFLSLEFNE